MDGQVFVVVILAISAAAVVSGAGIAGWIHTTRLRIKNGYPLSGAWGQSVYPKATTEEVERIKLLSNENAQLRAELGSVKDRLATVERIVTDGGFGLTHQIEALRDQPKN
ncbi:hypothetical protein ACFFF7_02805 [Novosphingobium aquiterrae]|uniref:Uncharacterized protein n=1 Tax=Novosphingobium aquiterrae TaxID=624388 RepID=A0ABV6PET0_9SPHN